MEVKVLGACCAKCMTTHELIGKVIMENNLQINLSKVTDMMEIMNYNVMSLPAVVVDGVVKIKGRVPSETEIKDMLGL